jgi:cytoskeletal protein CcmA (bactofilin family)
MADVTVVGQTMFLKGSIRGDGDLEIHGRIEGDVEVGGEVTIAEGALVKADIAARRIVVRGAVAGNLTGEDGVRLEDGARVVGDVKGATIGIVEGALLRGNIETGQGARGAQKATPRAGRAERQPPAARVVEPKRAAPAPVAAKTDGAARRAPAEERPGPPPPVVPALKRGARAALKRRAR